MAEKTATRKKGSLKKILEGKNVFVDFEWTYNRDNKNKAYRNLNPDSTSRSYILQEIERDFAFYSQEDKAGVAEWQKLKDSGATTPGGKPIAFEKDNKKFIVISEIFNGDQRTETVLNKQWYNRNLKDIAPDFVPENIRNWDELQKQLSIYQKGNPSELFETLEQNRISAIKRDNQDSRGRSISGIEDGIGFKKNAPTKKEDIGEKGEDPKTDEENLVDVTLNDNPNLVPRKSNLGKSNLYYPIDMDISNMDYLLIKIINYKPIGDGFIRGRGENRSALTGLIPTEDIVPSPSNLNPDGSINNYAKEERDFIFLPIPSNIQDGNSVSFAENSLDALSAGLANFAGGSIDELTAALSKLQNFGQVPEKLEAEFQEAFGGLGPTAKEMLKKSLLAQAANLTGISNASFQSLLARESGSILNPNKELLFNGVSLRTFRFSFKLTPRSKDEGIAIKQIIRSLKSNMAPRVVGSSEGNVDPDNQRSGQFLRTPNVFELQYMKGRIRHPFLNYFKTCALTDMSVKYTGENIYSTYNEGTPVSMIMDLTFKELEPIYDIDYTEDNDQETKSVGY